VVVAAASPADVTNETVSEDKMMEMKREWFGNFCKGECNKLKCQNFHPIPANGQCICMSCDMGDVGQLPEPGPEVSKDLEGHGKPRMRNVMLNVTTTNSTFDGKMLRTGENENTTLMNATCNLECGRLDCTHFTANEKTDNCLCHNCDLELGKSSTGQDSGGNRDKRLSLIFDDCGYWDYSWDYYYYRYRYGYWRSCPYRSVRRSRTRSRYTCTRASYYIKWYGYIYWNRCYYETYTAYYYASVCNCSANILTETCGGNAGSTSSPNFGCSISNG
jgi:hypothetical protein